MRPLLQLASDGKDHLIRNTIDELAKEFSLTDAERSQLLPSGRQPLFTNRLAWAKTHLRMAGLLDAPSRGVFRITPRGKALLKEHPDRIDLRILQTQPGYLEARNAKSTSSDKKIEATEEVQTPEEQIESASVTLRENLGEDILAKLKAASPTFFERAVVELLVRMGYGGTRKDAGQAIGRTGDEGIDGIIKEDRLGLDTIYIQAKKWEATVGRPEIQKFAGALQGFRAKKGIFLTTSDFSRDAQEFANKIDSKIVLIDGETLWNLMIDHGLGVTTVASYVVNRLDNDFFDDES
ncbi:MAG: restriction endonuclease [Verrucomicrobiota bacterium]